MRLICTLANQQQAMILSNYLKSKGIENRVDAVKDTDWGSANYGDFSCNVWVIDEDQMNDALQIAQEFQANPQNPLFIHANDNVKIKTKEDILRNIKVPPQKSIEKQMGKVTLYFIILCSLVLGYSYFTSPPYLKEYPKNIPLLPLVSPDIQKNLMFDYPKAYQLVDQFVQNHGEAPLEAPQNMSADAKAEYEQILQTTYWKGLYLKALEYFKGNPVSFSEPMFEKIKEGEIWRLFTPAILHYDVFHLLFNMLLLAFIGKQIEDKIGSFKTLLFILVTGIFTNLVEYLMAGPNFLGFSGVLCAMVTFVWMRQRIATWEGYQFQKSSFDFIMIFILGIFALQLTSFVLEITHNISIAPAIANAAHLSGALIGLILGRLPYFSQRSFS